MLKITDVKIKVITYQVRVKAVATIEIDNCFVVNDIKIVESSSGLFIMMPNRRTPDGDFKDIAHPINQETREYIQATILKKYKEIIGE